MRHEGLPQQPPELQESGVQKAAPREESELPSLSSDDKDMENYQAIVKQGEELNAYLRATKAKDKNPKTFIESSVKAASDVKRFEYIMQRTREIAAEEQQLVAGKKTAEDAGLDASADIESRIEQLRAERAALKDEVNGMDSAERG